MICVQDQWVPKVVEELIDHKQDRVFSAVHCSGILPLSVLAPLAEINQRETGKKETLKRKNKKI